MGVILKRVTKHLMRKENGGFVDSWRTPIACAARKAHRKNGQRECLDALLDFLADKQQEEERKVKRYLAEIEAEIDAGYRLNDFDREMWYNSTAWFDYNRGV